MNIIHRISEEEQANVPNWNLDPILTNILWSRGVRCPNEAVYPIDNILRPTLKGVDRVAAELADAVISGQSIMIVGDYDADGATSTALAIRFFRDIGYNNICFEIPSRQDDGYGLNNSIVMGAVSRGVNIIITVDNGITACESVRLAVSQGIKVYVTDHHLPGENLPVAQGIINPHMPGDDFPSKNLAGVGVIFYVIAALRGELFRRNYFQERDIKIPVVSNYLDFVALGTIADMVPLDYNNRLMVSYGVGLIREGKTTGGLLELIKICGLSYQNFKSSDISFSLCPRINAAGRIADMKFGVQCLLAEKNDEAKVGASLLHNYNIERRNIESVMMGTALTQIRLEYDNILPEALVLYNSSFNAGVMGIVAAKIKDLTGLTTIILSDSPEEDYLVGSVRGTEGYHVCDALKRISAVHPEFFKAYGGHRGAAGLTVVREFLTSFKEEFILDCRRFSGEKKDEVIVTDGSLPDSYFVSEFARVLVYDQPWGTEFTSPLFDGVYMLVNHYVVGGKHLSVKVRLENGLVVSGIYYNYDVRNWPNNSVRQVRMVFGFDLSKNRCDASLKLIIRNMEPFPC